MTKRINGGRGRARGRLEIIIKGVASGKVEARIRQGRETRKMKASHVKRQECKDEQSKGDEGDTKCHLHFTKLSRTLILTCLGDGERVK